MVEPLHRLTFEQFLAVEATHEGSAKHELVGGQMFAMTGSSLRHAACIARLVAALLPAADAESCRVYQGDALLRVDEAGYYPDVLVACGDQPAARFEVAPCLLVEVLSPSTEGIDQREKLVAYQSLGSLHAYLLVDHHRMEITAYERDGAIWSRRTLGIGASLELRCPRGDLRVDDVFWNLPAAS